MSSLERLSANQLNKMLKEAKIELKRREIINEARKDIQAVLKKYNINIHDLDLNFSNRKTATKKAATKKSTNKKTLSKKPRTKKAAAKALREGDQRTVVAPKYHNIATGEKWSGRGRAPVWVTNLCTAENINIEEFKSRSRKHRIIQTSITETSNTSDLDHGNIK